MKILALEPFYGGSHKAFLDGWAAVSRHTWTTLGLPAFKWKWRMRHGPVTLAENVNGRVAKGERFDLLFCSDMLDLATFRGLVAESIRDLPSVAYFHENQLTYPVRSESERDYHFAVTNLTTCLAADRVWFNSEFHRDSFLSALPHFLKRMPDFQLLDNVAALAPKTSVMPQGIENFGPKPPRQPGPLHILWAARWEHDKNPEAFFDALRILKRSGAEFRVSVIGEQFDTVPEVFSRAKKGFRDQIINWGYQPDRAAYRQALCEADVVVSTADHEFFGVSVIEAIASGAWPLVPQRLAYPEILELAEKPDRQKHFWDGSVEDLATRLADLASRVSSGQPLPDHDLFQTASRYQWSNLAPCFDEALERMV